MTTNNYDELTALVQASVDKLMDPAISKSVNLYSGTLFVECNEYSASQIQMQLIKDLNCFVQKNKLGPLYVFDFI